MRVVSDADVIIHLSNLKKLSLLKSLYDKVAIPEYVKSEILVKETPEIKRAFNSFIAVFPTSKTKAKDISRKHNIHTGEAHVKLLGEDLKAKLFLSNERKVRRAAKEEGFSVVGTIGVILRAVKNSLIDMSEAASLLEKMKSQDFRIHPDILQKAISVIKEL
jgi:predicted nucleic acid-binding protein